MYTFCLHSHTCAVSSMHVKAPSARLDATADCGGGYLAAKMTLAYQSTQHTAVAKSFSGYIRHDADRPCSQKQSRRRS